jgi:hypothetical protein
MSTARALATVLLFAGAFVVTFSVEVSLAKGPRVTPGEGVDRCQDSRDCVESLTDPESCCPMCGAVVITKERRGEMYERCQHPHGHCSQRAAACGRPRPTHPYCDRHRCIDLEREG